MMTVRLASSAPRTEVARLPISELKSVEKITSSLPSRTLLDSIHTEKITTHLTLKEQSLGAKRVELSVTSLETENHEKPCQDSATSGPKQVPIEESTTSTRRKRRNLRRCDVSSNTSYIDVKGPWKRLPRPDMDLIRASRAKYISGAEEPRRSRPRRCVRFKSVQVRRYGQTLGDNPAVSNGAPIQLDWCFNEDPPVNINTFQLGRKPRPLRQLVLSRFYRHAILMHWYKFSEDEIRTAKEEAKKVRRNRLKSAMMSDARFLEDCIFSSIRKVTRLIFK
jgi:hypothetical protein